MDNTHEPITTLFAAIAVVEGDDLATEERQLEAWQWLVDHGYAYHLQGWYGRTASHLIEAGLITAPA